MVRIESLPAETEQDLAQQIADLLQPVPGENQNPSNASLTLAESFRIWTPDLSAEGGAHAAHEFEDTGCWQHLVLKDGKAMYLAESWRVEGRLEIQEISSPRDVGTFDRILDGMDQAFAGADYQVRVLSIPSYALVALWFHKEPEQAQAGRIGVTDEADRIAVVIQPKRLGFATQEIYGAERFLEKLAATQPPLGAEWDHPLP